MTGRRFCLFPTMLLSFVLSVRGGRTRDEREQSERASHDTESIPLFVIGFDNCTILNQQSE